MFDQVMHLLSKLSHTHLNILMLLGIALFGGTFGGRLFQKLRIPQVVGYISVGILLGQTGANIVNEQVMESFQLFNYFALGLIGFTIGGELKKETFLKYGKQIIYVLLFEGIAAFILVAVLVGTVGSLLMGNSNVAWALGLLLGAIASATAPAATTNVLWEYKSKGPLTTTILGIVAMDDALALLLFAVASSVAGLILGNGNSSLLGIFVSPLYEIMGSVFIGIFSGLILSKILDRHSEEDRVLAFSIGIVLLALGIALLLDFDILLASMSLGVTVVNLTPRKSQDMFKLLGGFTPPIYVLFFVLVGAELNLSYMSVPMILIALIYLIGRTIGKMGGATLGARLSHASQSVRKYLPLCLFSQAGVAIGLSILAGHLFPGKVSNAIVIIVISTVFVLELTGPAFVKIAVTKAGEAGLNVTEEDLIKKSKVRDIMDPDPPVIYENMCLNKILEVFSNHDNLYYPVVNKDKYLMGIISIDHLKKTFMLSGLNEFLLAYDLMEPVIAVIHPDTPMTEAKETMSLNRTECLPVVSEDNKLLGFVESRSIQKLISQKIAELERKSLNLEPH
ncbi:MAG: CBS domain-containing protein [Candidatus Aminicenantes bacterium]|nr:CBS domain-containing protein [Candidatus Aminicenantes bacterium]